MVNSRFAQTRHDSEHQIELCDNLSQSCDNTHRFFDKKEGKRKNPILLIGSMGHFCELFDQLLRRLEPAVNRAAMNPDPFGKGFDRATLLQVNLNHLLPLCRQVESGGAWDTAGIDEI